MLCNSIGRQAGSVAVDVRAKVAHVVHCVHSVRHAVSQEFDNSFMPLVASETSANIGRTSQVKHRIVREC